MTEQEVFNEITSKPKWYAGYISAQYATNIKRKFNNGTLSYRTMKKLFNHYGYDAIFVTWQKVPDITFPREIISITEDESGITFVTKPKKP